MVIIVMLIVTQYLRCARSGRVSNFYCSVRVEGFWDEIPVGLQGTGGGGGGGMQRGGFFFFTQLIAFDLYVARRQVFQFLAFANVDMYRSGLLD